jgi:hypothetical protein
MAMADGHRSTDRRTQISGSVTAAIVAGVGAVAGLLGDACHISSGTTQYLRFGTPTIGLSAVWFPIVVGAGVLGVARAGLAAGLPASVRTRGDAAAGIAAALALYALTAALRGQPAIVSCTLCSAIAFLIWRVWDPARGTFLFALGAAVLGTLSEIVAVKLQLWAYAPDASALAGVAPWLPCQYFAEAAVASGLWAPIAGSQRQAPHSQGYSAASPSKRAGNDDED